MSGGLDLLPPPPGCSEQGFTGAECSFMEPVGHFVKRWV